MADGFVIGVSNSGIFDDLEWPSWSFTYPKTFQMGFSYSCAALNKISTDITRRAVPLRQLSFMFLHIDCCIYVYMLLFTFYFFTSFFRTCSLFVIKLCSPIFTECYYVLEPVHTSDTTRVHGPYRRPVDMVVIFDTRVDGPRSRATLLTPVNKDRQDGSC